MGSSAGVPDRHRHRRPGGAAAARWAPPLTDRARCRMGVFANELLDGQGRERAVIVLGDLNDEPTAATTQILLGPPGSEIGRTGLR